MTTTPTSGAADLRTAAQAVVDRWDTPLWKDVPATAEYIGRLRAALAAGQATAAQVVVLDDVAALVRAAQAFVLEPDSHKKKLELEAMAWGPLAAAPQPVAREPLSHAQAKADEALRLAAEITAATGPANGAAGQP